MAGRVERLYLPRETPVHRLGAQCKIVAVLAFVIAVVLTPPTAYPAFAGYAALLVAVAALARIPAGTIARRMLVETPFVVFALAMPLLTPGPRVQVAGLALSEPGLVSAWNVLAKATIGVVASILLAATTDLRDMLIGLERLRLPNLLVQIISFMIRYLDVLADEIERMRIARLARGFEARDLRQLPVLARSLGTLFIRAYERGERVHLAMLSRGYTGQLPLAAPAVPLSHWTAALLLPAAAAVISVLAR